MKMGNCFVCLDYKMIHARKSCKTCYQRLSDQGKLDTLPAANPVRTTIPRRRTGNVATK